MTAPELTVGAGFYYKYFVVYYLVDVLDGTTANRRHIASELEAWLMLFYQSDFMRIRNLLDRLE